MAVVGKRVLAQFKSEEGSLVGVPLDLPVDVNEASLADLCNVLLENVSLFTEIDWSLALWCDIRTNLPLMSSSCTRKR